MPVNVQHDCWAAQCQANGTWKVIQEREETVRTINVMQHSEDGRFIINMHSLHNSNYLHNIIPPELYDRAPVSADRDRLHRTLAETLSPNDDRPSNISGQANGDNSNNSPADRPDNQGHNETSGNNLLGDEPHSQGHADAYAYAEAQAHLGGSLHRLIGLIGVYNEECHAQGEHIVMD